jgi:pullulanase/glycogen debranching enzyme
MGKRVREGSYFPQGATPVEGGVNFALYSKHAEGVDLLLFDRPLDATPAEVIQINNRTVLSGTALSRASLRDSFTLTVCMVPTSRKTACASTPTGC